MSSGNDKEVGRSRRRKPRGRRVRNKTDGGYGYGTYGEFFLGGYSSAISPKLLLRRAAIRTWFRLRRPAVLGTLLALLVLGAVALKMLNSTWTIATLGGHGTASVKGSDWARAKAARVLQGLGSMGSGQGASVAPAMSLAGRHPWDDDLQRKALEAIVRSPRELDAVSASGVGARARWFLQGSNAVDELRGMGRRALIAAEQFDEVPGVWDVAEARNPEDVGAAMVAAMAAMHPEVVPWLWSRLPEDARGDAALRDCLVAWEAGWGTDPQGKAVEEVKRWITPGTGADESHEHRLRLALLTSIGRAEVALGSAAMSGLARMSKDRAADHVAYWDLLRSAGREDEVARLASAMGSRPATAAGGALMVAAWTRHGLPELGAEALTRFPEVAEVPHPFPMIMARAFMKAGRWSDLGQLASKVGNARTRRDRRWNTMRTSYAVFLDAVAANGAEVANVAGASTVPASRREVIEGRLRVAIDTKPMNDVLATDMACVLENLGYPEFGRRVQDLADTTTPSGVEAWRKMAWLARRAGLHDVMLEASRRLLEIDADIPMHRLYFLEANAQSVSKERKPPAKAMESLAGVQMPVVFEFLRAVGLAKAGLNREAAALLATLPSSGLSPRELSWRNIALIEAGAHGGGQDLVTRLAQGVAMGCVGKERQGWLHDILRGSAKGKGGTLE